MAEKPHPGYWQDWLNLVLGAWLFVSPWVLGYAGVDRAAWNAWGIGTVLVALGAASVMRFSRSAEGVFIVLGLWLVVAPWVLNVQAVPPPVYWNAVAVGVLVALLAAGNLTAHWRRRLFR